MISFSKAKKIVIVVAHGAQHAAKIIFAVSEVSKEVVYGALKNKKTVEFRKIHK
jgi:hypothetical protein